MNLHSLAQAGRPLQINSAHVKGELGTGFEKAEKLGEFECGNCRWFRNDSCGQPDMMRVSKQPRLANGRVKVGEEDCCEYVYRVGRKDNDETND